MIYTDLCHTRNDHCELALTLQVDRFKNLNTDLGKKDSDVKKYNVFSTSSVPKEKNNSKKSIYK